MHRLNDKQLNQRIHKFLYRKFAEFPELKAAPGRTASSWATGSDERIETHTAIRWGLQPL